MSTFERVQNVVSHVLGVEAGKVFDHSSIINDLGADSLDTVEVAMAIEQEFGIEVSDDEFESLLTVGDVVKHVDGLLRG